MLVRVQQKWTTDGKDLLGCVLVRLRVRGDVGMAGF